MWDYHSQRTVFPPNSTTLFLLNKEKQEPKKVVTEKLLLNYSKWLRYGSLHYLCAVMAGFGPANLQRDKLAS